MSQADKPQQFVGKIFTDSRDSFHKNDLFVALKGERFDGHKFIPDLVERGLRFFIVDETFKSNKYQDSSFIQVADTLQALQQIAEYHRKQFDFPVIGITGSNGKTIVKEYLYQLLSTKYNVVKSPRSYNSQVGVPLSLLQIEQFHDLGIFEAGISTTSEMKNLEKMIAPEIGIFTNLGTAHDEGFRNEEEKLKEKLILFKTSEVIIYQKKQVLVHHVIREMYPKKQLLIWQVVDKQNIDVNGELFLVPAANHNHEIENLGHCIALMKYLGISKKSIESDLKSLQQLPLRLQILRGRNHSTLINDSYNNDLAGFEVALKTAAQQNKAKPITLILSDFQQTGLSAELLSNRLNSILSKYQVDQIYAIGDFFSDHHLSGEYQFLSFLTTKEFLDEIDKHDFSNKTILIKGARKYRFEEISKALEEKVHDTAWEINLSSFIHNINVYKSLLNPGVKLLVMVKALAYGTSAEQMAKVLQNQNIDYLGVAYPNEGLELRRAGITTPILVMNTSSNSFEVAIRAKLEIETYSIDHLKSLINYLKFHRILNYPVHLKVETGMNRLGFSEFEIEELKQLLKSEEIQVKGIFSHLSSADEEKENDFSLQQQAKFQSFVQELIPVLKEKPILHLLNSSGISNKSLNQFDMVRLGIGAHGISSDPELQLRLEQIGTLKASVSQIKHIQKGESVGYSRAFTAPTDMKIGIITIGYADGYDRRFGNGVGKVIVKNQLTNTVGNICMDMCFINLTNIEDVKAGDEVIITGKNLPIQELAEAIGTIPYELLTNISNRVIRKFIFV